jgi:hypothetical protein
MQNLDVSSDHFALPSPVNIPDELAEKLGEGADKAEGPSEPSETEIEGTMSGGSPENDLANKTATIYCGALTPKEKAIAMTDSLKKDADLNLGNGDLSRVQTVIIYGKVLSQIKACVKEAKMEGGWEGYMENFSPIKKRTIQNWMYLYNNPQLHPYAWMGEERLLKAARRSKKYGGDNPIGEFLKEERLAPIPEGGWVSMVIKKKIDNAMAKAPSQPQKTSGVNSLTDRLIVQLSKGLEDAEFLAKVDDGKLEALQATIKDVRAKLLEKQ